MKHKTLATGSFFAVGIFAVLICVGMGTGFLAEKPFISVDPVSDKNTGDQLTITGTTSLPTGTHVIVEVYPASFEDQTGTGYGNFNGATGTVAIVKGTGEVNTWSWPLDTATFKPGEYRVSVSSVNGDISANTKFTLRKSTTPAASGPSVQYIRIEPVADKTTGDLLIVTGTTNLPEGSILLVQAGNYGGNTEVHKGTGEENRFSSPVDTSGLKPGTQTITVTQMIGDLAKGDYRPGTIVGTTTYLLKGPYRGTDTPVQPAITKDDYIRLDTIVDRSAGDQFLVTGTTSLPAGASLIWEVMPDTGTIPTVLDMNTKGILTNNQVTKGDSTTNRVSLAVDMNGFAPGKWVVLVGVMKGEQTPDMMDIGEPKGYARFTLK